jgi:hypothetical protein
VFAAERPALTNTPMQQGEVTFVAHHKQWKSRQGRFCGERYYDAQKTLKPKNSGKNRS